MGLIKRLKDKGHLHQRHPEVGQFLATFQKQDVGDLDEATLGSRLLDLGKTTALALLDGTVEANEVAAIGLAVVQAVRACGNGRRREREAEEAAPVAEEPVAEEPVEPVAEEPVEPVVVEEPVEPVVVEEPVAAEELVEPVAEVKETKKSKKKKKDEAEPKKD